MKRLLIGVTAAFTMAVINPIWAQAPTQGASSIYAETNSYRLVAPTPEDAYREGLINRGQLEQLTGPTPQALQGPSPNGYRGFDK